MPMYRHKIEAAKTEAERFIQKADEALERLDLETKWRDERYNELDRLGVDGPRPAPGTGPGDYSYGSAETGTLRRASMDLTRQLAELRK